ncbi:MAG: YIP1 family protein [Acidobacteria bacterium]|nr:YIP1 family protein [Acidobacteriota bacterium]
MTTFLRRLLAALALDPRVFEEVEADRRATGQALAVVLAAAVGAGIGNAGLGDGATTVMIVAALGSVVAWFAWASLLYLIGSKILPEPTTSVDLGQVLRTLGFAAAPGIFRAFEIFGGTRWFVLPLTSVWMVWAMVIAIRQAFDYTNTTRAVALSLLGWAITVGVALVVGLLMARPVS